MARTPKVKVTLPVEDKSQKSVAVQDLKQSQSVESFIAQAIQQGVSVDILERLFGLREKVKAEAAREAFISAMAKFQAECPTIQKTKAVIVNNRVAYAYAPIESIVSQVKEAIQNNGFSYSTNMKMLLEGVVVTVKVQHILGHSEETEMTVPLGTKTGIMSASQQVAAASTFAKRYAFLNAFGILTGDEDNDGQDIAKGNLSAPTKPIALDNPVVDGYKKKMEKAKTLVELGTIWANMAPEAKKVLSATKDEMKAMLESELHLDESNYEDN